MTVYVLRAYEPYEPDVLLFRGTEEQIRKYIQDNTTKGAPFNGREFKNVIKVAGYFLDDLELLIEGPEVRDYLE